MSIYVPPRHRARSQYGCGPYIIVILLLITITACRVRHIITTEKGNRMIEVFTRADVKRYERNTADGIRDTLYPIKIIMIPKHNPNQ